MTEKKAIATLHELFPSYPQDILIGVLETENWNLEAAIDSLVRLDSEVPNPPTSSLSADFLEPTEPDEKSLAADVANLQLADELSMQVQLEQILKESREEAKRGKASKGNWRQKLKGLFKRKQKLTEVKAEAEEPKGEIEVIDDEEEVISFGIREEDARNVRGERLSPRREEIPQRKS